MLLIITNKNDFAVDYLINKLLEKDLPYFRLNSEDLAELEFNAELTTHSTKIIRDKKNSVCLNKVTTIWYRRAISPSITSSKYSKGEINFINGELRHLVEGLLLSLDAKWINSIDATYLGERKLYQLEVASSLGFNVPKSLVTNQHKDAVQFLNSCERGIICKPIFHGLLFSDNSAFAIHTNRVDESDLNELKTSNMPIYLQEEVDRVCDLRVTVVGRDIYTVKIQHDVEKTPDWRVKNQEVKQSVSELPSFIKDLIYKLMDALDLEYGALDFILDKDGNYVFLEVNPAGEWAWLENDLGLPISESLIRLFYGEPSE